MTIKLRLLESEQGAAAEFTEAAQLSSGNEEGTIWKVAVLAFGKSKRPPHYVYTREAAQRSIDRFEGARVYANSVADDFGHKAANQKVPRDTVGVLSNVTVTESELQADLHVLPSASWLRQNLLYSQTKKLPIPYELSIDATGFVKPAAYNGETLPVVESFDRVSVDVVERGAAGGKILRMVASQTQPTSTRSSAMNVKTKLLTLFALLYPAFLESKKVDTAAIDENQLFTYLLEADKPQPALKLPDGMQLTEDLIDKKLAEVRAKLTASAPAPAATPPEPKIGLDTNAAKELKEARQAIDELKRQSAVAMLESQLAASKLPVTLQGQIRASFTGRDFVQADVEKAIKDTREVWSKLIATPADSRGLDVNLRASEADKMQKAIEAFFMLDPNRPNPQADEKDLRAAYKESGRFNSIREAYIKYTGDEHVTGRVDASRLTESMVSGDWTNIISTAMNKRLVRDYGMLNLDTWRSFADIVPLANFKQQQRVRYGGYANLSTVSEGAPYTPLTSPTDEKATYSPAKRGGTEDVTREMIMNDDVSSIVKIPQRMARAAAQTLHEFVWDFLRPGVNPTIYTGGALYTAGQTNYYSGTDTLATAGKLGAIRTIMAKFAQGDNSKRLGIRLRYLAVPTDLAETAYGLVTPAYDKYNQTPSYMQSLGIVPIVVEYWADTNDFVCIADRADVVGLEVGFVNGQETPEMFVQDMPNVGAMFSNDKVTYKIRHEYGGAVIDWRAFYGHICTS